MPIFDNCANIQYLKELKGTMLIFRNCADVQINSLVGAYPPNAFQSNVRTAYTKKEVRTRTL